MTTYIHPDNPFFGGMEQVILAFMIIYLIGVIVFLFVVALIIKYILIAIFERNDKEEHNENNIVDAEEASDGTVVDNSAQPVDNDSDGDT